MNLTFTKWSTKKQLVITYIVLFSFFMPHISTMRTKRKEKQQVSFSNTWAMEVMGGEDAARLLSNTLGFKYLGPMGSLKNYYMVRQYKPTSTKRTRRSVDLKTKSLNYLFIDKNFKISLVEPQKVLSRKKRDYKEDPMFKQQWYLNNTGIYIL